VDKIIEELLGAIANGDIQALIDYYRYLDVRFFSRLDSRFQRTIKKFELCLLRHYLIHGKFALDDIDNEEANIVTNSNAA
jgi:hypothetical protein